MIQRTLLFLFLFVLAACLFTLAGLSLSVWTKAAFLEIPASSPTPSPSMGISGDPSPTSIPPASTPEASGTPTKEPTVTEQPTATPSPLPVIQSEAEEWRWFSPDEVPSLPIPILLYHHVSDDPLYKTYTVNPGDFQEQMMFLKERGYTSIPVSLLVRAIKEGASLPKKPVVLTFDDGNADIFENAFPVMDNIGFSGTLYLVTNYLDHDGFLTSEEVSTLLESGWEIGSHSINHLNLIQSGNDIQEIYTSREILGDKFSVPVESFSYPFGISNHRTTSLVKDSGYLSGAGLGESIYHSIENLFYLSRIEIYKGISIGNFDALLPW